MVKYPPAVQESWVQSLGEEDPLEEGMTAHSSILAWRIPWTEKPVYSSKESDSTEQLTLSYGNFIPYEIFQLCVYSVVQLWDPTHHSLSGSSVCGIF